MASKGSIWASIGLKTDEFKKSLTDLQIKTKSTGSKLSSALSSINPITVGITAGVAAIGAAFGSVISTVKDFEAANSKLQSVLGVTKDEMAALIKQAKDLGASTAFTASQVTDLQTEFAKLGFPTKEILNMTESTLAAAAAMGSGLGEQAALTGATIKAFGLSSADAARVNDVLAKSTSRSALDFSKLNTSMSTIAPVASKLGFGLEDTVALLGNLSDSGFDASTAATATRNIMLKLADSTSVLGKRLKEPVKDLPSLIKGLKQLTNEGVDLSEALELTDVRSVAAFSTFLSGTDSLEKLSAELNNAKGAAQEMADVMLDNLAGDITKAGSAWEGFILSLEDGNGRISRALRDTVQWFTDFLGGLTKINKTIEEIEVDKVNKKFNEFKKAGVVAAADVKNSLEKLGLKGDDLTEALNRALIRARENFKAAKERGDLNMAATYAAERDALKDMVTEKKKDNSVTEDNIKLTKEQIKAIEDRNKAIQNALKDDAEEIEIPISGFVLEGDKEDIWGDIKADIPLEIDTDKLDKDLDVVNEKFDAMRERVIASGQAINNALMSVAQGGLEAIGASIGEAMAGGEGFASIAMTFAQTIADAVGSLGQQLIQIGITMTGIQKALSTVGFANPALLIGGGIALVALSQMMKTSMAKPVGFADGGLVTGSVFANIGEGIGTTSANPEVIAPLDKLKDFMPSGDGGMGGNVKFRIEGNTLVGILQRQEKTSKYSR